MSALRTRLSKGGLNTLSRGKLTVASFSRGSELVLEFRIHDAYGKTLESTLSLPQAREALRHLTDAVEALEAVARHDGPPVRSTPRDGVAEAPLDGTYP
ncbi:hypothetical protein BGCPKDLD_5257 [Methylorubrum suomiense]|uniref:DUF3509 domain-containing protein n=1 Tax=Methylorubrum suomiense TaxID=144191 RepID=A0ABQ4V5N3_9HYPH|nr:hypothetical protein BGCPKDLD_5257 [Methylorubrum suomiense]